MAGFFIKLCVSGGHVIDHYCPNENIRLDNLCKKNNLHKTLVLDDCHFMVNGFGATLLTNVAKPRNKECALVVITKVVRRNDTEQMLRERIADLEWERDLLLGRVR